jgi:DNA invertase Pin-like site-specific DNA recombinase
VVQAAAIYCRISSDPEGDRLGVTRQREDCEALAARKGWTVREVYIDDDRSAYSGKPRPEYRRLLDDIDGHAVDGLLVYNLDRLHRQPRELEAFFDVVDRAGLTALATVEGDINLGSHDGRFHARIMGAVARKASDDASRRISRKNLERAMKGLPTGGGARPFGYRDDRLTVDPGEAALVREAASRVLAGDAVRSIVVEWNERGIPTTEGKSWTIETLRRMLYSARISGQREYRGEIVANGVWEPIITPEETARLRATLDERSRSRTRSTRRYLLAGLLRCGLCGTTLISRPDANGAPRYVCPSGLGQSGCGRIAIKAEPLEEFIELAILERLDSPAIAATLRGAAEADALTAAEQEALARDREQLDELAAAYGERQVTFSEWLAARRPIEARIEATRRKLSRMSQTAALDPYLGNAAELRERWSSLILDRQRSIVSALLDRAVIGPAVRGRTTFDAGRIEPVWRDG